MKPRTSFLKRSLALALALVLLVSSMNLGGVLQVFAVDNSETVSAGELVANNYELTAEEKALLSSGMLVGDAIEYTVPADAELITVDTELTTITAEKAGDWTPTTAYIVAGGATVETIALVDGVGTYDAEKAGNAFSVKVKYELSVEVDADVQATLLNTAAWLKDGLANANTVSGQSGNLYILEQAMPELVNLANTGINAGVLGTVKLSDECKAAINALNDQMTANGGQLDLSVTVAEYDAAASKVEYLLTEGANMKADTEALVANVSVISTALTTIAQNLQWIIDNGWLSPTVAEQLKTLAKVAANLSDNLTGVAQVEWTAADKGTALVNAETVNYTELDQLVNALTEITAAPEVKNPLFVADTTIQKNLAMWDVTVTVKLQTVKNEVGSNELVENETVKTVTLTLADKATAAEIQAAIDESGIVAEAQAAWGTAYVDGQYVAAITELPETLTDNLAYEVVYSPKEYTITYGYVSNAPTTVYYGYQLALPVHANAEQAYDYTVNGEPYAQGDVVVITGNTTVNRSAGKAYSVTDFYTVVSNNYGNDVAQSILQSGALNGNSVISVRKPDPADSASLLQLLDGTVTAQDYSAAYQNLSWVPYTYGVGEDVNYFSGNTAPWNGKSVEVKYILNLTNFSVAEVQSALDLAATLKAEANVQKTTMDSFAGAKAQMGQLDKVKLGALNGVIDVTDFSTDPEKNAELRAYFKSLVSGIIANNLDTNGYLKIYNMLVNYETEGLRYYYENYDAIRAEVESLAGYLEAMMADQEKMDALVIMVTAAGFPEYAEKIAGLEVMLNTYLAKLSAPNAAIDLDSANLGKLITALTAEGEVVCQEADYAYLLSENLTALDESQVMVQIIISTPKGDATVTTGEMDRGTVLTEEIIASLKEKAAAKAAELLGANAKYYTMTADVDLDSLIGTEVNTAINVYYTYTATAYTVMIEGEDDQIVTIEDLEINLPKHPTANWEYRYTVDGVTGITASTYTFTAEQLDRLFVDGTYTITRVAVDTVVEKLEENLEEWIQKDENGNIVGLEAAIEGNKDGVMTFAMTLMNAGYTDIKLNGESLLYMNEEQTMEISLQTLINAILADNTFGSEKLIKLSNEGKGELITTTMTLDGTEVPFTLTLSSVPGAMAKVASALTSVKQYMTFNSKDGVLDIKLNLPEKVYEVYLTALLATGHWDKENIDAINSEIAFQFLWDYVDQIINTNATTATFTNTMHKLNIGYNVNGYEQFYQIAKTALTNEGVVINPGENGLFDMSISANCKTGVNKIAGVLGMDLTAYDMYLGMIKEYKGDGSNLSVNLNANLVNTETAYQALVLDLNASGVQNKFDYTTDLPARVPAIVRHSALMLLDDVEGGLAFGNGTAILDLNGKTITGDVSTTGTLYIIDSTMDTDSCGGITGNISGNVKIIAGVYANDVSAFLAKGYVWKNGYVSNKLYTMNRVNVNGVDNVSVILNSDLLNEFEKYFPSVKALALDIATDLVLNHFTAAAMTIEGNEIYAVNLEDVFDLLSGTNRTENAINELLSYIKVDNGIEGFINTVLADMLDFGAIADAIKNETALATYEIATMPWEVVVGVVDDTNPDEYVDNSYFTLGIAGNADLEKSYNLSLILTGDPAKTHVAPLAEELAAIVLPETHITVDLEQPTYTHANKTFSGIAGAVDAAFVADLSANNNYATIIGVALAYGNPDLDVLPRDDNGEFIKDENGVAVHYTRADLVDALNNKNVDTLKKIVEASYVRDVVDSLKKLSRTVSFADMAAELGVTIKVADAAELERVYHLVACGLGALLERLDVTGYNVTIGSYDDNGDGWYVAKVKNYSKDTEITYGGISAEIDATITNLTVKIKIFADHEHTYGNWYVTTPADCENPGEERRDCDCGAYETREIPATGHTYGEWYETTAPGCETPGEERHDCACGHYETREIPATGHDWDPELKCDGTHHWEECKNCGETRNEAAHELEYEYNNDQHRQFCDCGYTTVWVDHDHSNGVCECGHCLIGDVNHDGLIDIRDAVLIQEYLAEMETPVFCTRGADVNGDGEIDVRDAVLMREYLAEIIDEFPAENN